MSRESKAIRKDVVIIGAGISGLATAKCMKESGFDVVVLERTGDVGGLWKFRENDYGVMRFTHINVSKYNYCFSDFPFPDDVPDYPHNTDMAKYIEDYAKQFDLFKDISFYRKVTSLEQTDNEWTTTTQEIDSDENKLRSLEPTEIYISKYVAIATGHHAKPSWPKFPGMESFQGKVIHSIDFKDAVSNDMVGKRVLVIGIGNSAVDAAVNCATVGRWNLNPRMHALQTQPTVSPTLIHHIQRKEVKIVPNVERIENNRVYFMSGESAEFDHIIYCTGYKVDLSYLSEELESVILDKENNSIKLYKNVFSPKLGHTLAFIGFVQPASGGVLSMSETQARWFAELCKGKITLPSKSDMSTSISKEQRENSDRYYQSARHTLQRDPILYADEISSYFGAKPEFLKHPDLAWRLLWGSCGTYQYRLQGPHAWKGAKEAVKKVPVTDLMHYTGVLLVVVLGYLFYILFTLTEGCCH